MELVNLIHEELLKSAELTGIWEKKLREIEKKSYNAGTFLEELKTMVKEVVNSVLSDNTNRRVTTIEEKKDKEPEKKSRKKKESVKSKTAKPALKKDNTKTPKIKNDIFPKEGSIVEGAICPQCGKGHIIKGKTAFGCSEWKNGCTFRKPFE